MKSLRDLVVHDTVKKHILNGRDDAVYQIFISSYEHGGLPLSYLLEYVRMNMAKHNTKGYK